ncbi:hypothetical protein WEI85_20220 [Actinomycetes bacterium KLBMP 9797]
MASFDTREPGEREGFPNVLPEEWPLRESRTESRERHARGEALAEKLEAFDKLDDTPKEKAASEIRNDIADIVARAVTEEHQRKELLDALANFRTDQTLARHVEPRPQFPNPRFRPGGSRGRWGRPLGR